MSILTGPGIIIAEWCNLGLTLLLVVFRQFLRWHFGNKFNLCDFFVVLAWVSFLLQGVLDTAILKLGYFDGKISNTATEYGPEHGLATYDDTVTALKILYVETITYYNCMYCVKWAMLAFYGSLIPRHMKKLRFALWVTVALTIVGFISTFFVKLLICLPMSANYIPGKNNCDPTEAESAVLVRWIQHVVTDVLVYILPLFLLKTLQIGRSQKIGVALTFVVGFVCIFFACAENVSIWLFADDPTIWFLANLEQTWAIIVVCCPSFRALFKYIQKNKNSQDMSGTPGSYGADGSRKISRASKATNGASLQGATKRGEFTTIRGKEDSVTTITSVKRVTADEEMADEFANGAIPLERRQSGKMQDSIMVTYEIESAQSSAASNHGIEEEDEKKLVPGRGKLTTVAYS